MNTGGRRHGIHDTAPAARWGDAPPDEGLLRQRLDALPAEYEQLLARHAPLHSAMYERVELDLEVSAAERAQPVGELLAAQRRDPSPSPALLEAVFHAGRYLLISSSGVLPPRLTGLWLGEWGAAWSGDLTTDANVNLQLAGAGVGALPEAVESLRALIADQIVDWRENARAVYGARGVLAGLLPPRSDRAAPGTTPGVGARTDQRGPLPEPGHRRRAGLEPGSRAGACRAAIRRRCRGEGPVCEGSRVGRSGGAGSGRRRQAGPCRVRVVGAVSMKITGVVPWRVGAEGTGWGEYLFVEVRTDEGISGWGEITTTTPTANRSIASMVRQVTDLITGDDPARRSRK